jgi:hypothetical protein
MSTRVLLGFVLVASMVATVSAGQGLSPKQRKALYDAVTENFKDPSSAQFRKIELVDGRDAKKPGEGIYCGEVNAKNSYGAYAGYMPFIGAVLGDGALAINVASDADSTLVVKTLCQKARNGEFGS